MKRTTLAACIIAVAILVVLAVAARAEQRLVRTATAAPPQYDIPYTGKLTIWYARSREDLRKVIAVWPDNAGGVAFAARRKSEEAQVSTACSIYIVGEKDMKATGYNFNLVLRHELAHCNGWVGHDGGKKVPISTPKTPPELPESTRWLPIYPPLACVTPDRTVEPCDQRKPLVSVATN